MRPGATRTPNDRALKKQRGQAIVLILLVTVVAVLIGLSLVNSGILTSEKIQLQNAADATAFSLSTIEARDLNFTAYTNRAMVANEVAMGQMVGLMSWAAMAATTPAFLELYITPFYASIQAIPVVGQAISATIKATISALKAVFRVVKNGVKQSTKVGARFTPYFNQAYSTAQRGMHLATLYFSGMTLFDMIKANADDAHLSLYGWLMLARHMNTYYGDLDVRKKYDTFVTSYRQDNKWNKGLNIPHVISEVPKSKNQKEGMERLAALIHASRDPFSTNRDCSGHPLFGNNICKDPQGGWAVPLSITLTPPRVVDPITGVCIECVEFNFNIGLKRHGGSDLRYRTKKKNREQHYLWTAADLAGMAINFKLSVELGGVKIVDEDLHLDVPFGIGGAQAAAMPPGPAVKPFPPDKTMVPKILQGNVADHGYGDSPVLLPIAWAWPSPVPPNVAFSTSVNNINRKYNGLPRYNDTKPRPDPIKIDKNLKFGFEAPYILIALKKDIGDVKQSNARGRFALDSGVAGDKMAVLGKAEVYFSRPNDIGYFQRKDGMTELGNGFNPYWAARLVDTSYLDRTSALAIQQGQPWLAQDVTLALGQLKKLFSFLP